MTADVCAVCGQPLGDAWPHYPHDHDCRYGCEHWECYCDCLPVHPECCPCTRAAGLLDRIDRNRP